MKKTSFLKMCTLMICAFLVPIFAGCDLITINVNKYLNEPVAVYNNSITVTREELINLYNSVGYSRYDSSSTVSESGVKQTLELALNRAILVDFLTNDAQDTARANMGINKVTLDSYEAYNVWKSVYDYLNKTITGFEDELRADDGLSKLTPPEKEEASETSTEYKPFDKKYILEDGVLTKVATSVNPIMPNNALFDTADTTLTTSQKATLSFENFRTKYWEWHDSKVLNSEATNTISYSDKGWDKYLTALKNAEKERKLSTIDSEVFLREIERIYKVYYQNAVLTKFQTQYEQTISVTNGMVTQKFRELYASQTEIYNADESAFNKAVPTTAQNIYYIQNPQDYFGVVHILAKFSDAQTASMKALDERLEKLSINKYEYDREIAKIKQNTTVYNRDTGNYDKIVDVYNELDAILTNNSFAQKLVEFRAFMHRYSQDDATLNAEACYYIPHDSTKDTMEANFAKTSRELYATNQKGAYSNWIESSYGYHIIMYVGEMAELEPSDNDMALISQLNGYFLNPLYNKTMMDKVIENVTLSSYSNYETSLLSMIKAKKEITYYVDNYSDLYSK